MDRVEIRKFAIEKAVDLMGSGTLPKDVILKASEIETYIVGTAEIPEYIEKKETDFAETALSALSFLSALTENPNPDQSIQPEEPAITRASRKSVKQEGSAVE